MVEYPLGRRIQRRLWFAEDRLPDRVVDSDTYERFTLLVGRVSCKFYGHQPERDQCGNPEHDFCIWCQKSVPNSWEPQRS